MQSGGERSHASAHSARQSTTDHDSGPEGRHVVAQVQAHKGIGCKPRNTKGIFVSSSCALGVRRDTHGTTNVVGESPRALFHVIKATAATRGAMGGSRPAVAATFPPHSMASKQESIAKPQQAQLQSGGTRHSEPPSGCGNISTGHTVKWDTSNSPAHTGPAKRQRGNIATAAISGPQHRTQATGHSQTDKVTPAAAAACASKGIRVHAANTPPSSDTTEDGQELPERYAPLGPMQTFKRKVGVLRPLAVQARPAPSQDRNAAH